MEGRVSQGYGMQMAIIMGIDKGTGPWIGVVITATHRQPDRQHGVGSAVSPAWLMNSCRPREYPAAARKACFQVVQGVYVA